MNVGDAATVATGLKMGAGQYNRTIAIAKKNFDMQQQAVAALIQAVEQSSAYASGGLATPASQPAGQILNLQA